MAMGGGLAKERGTLDLDVERDGKNGGTKGSDEEIRWEGRSPCWRGPDRRMRNGTTTRTTKRLVVIRLAE
jgi:hypothetical protein